MTDLRVIFGILVVAALVFVTFSYRTAQRRRSHAEIARNQYLLLEQAIATLDTSEYLAVSDVDRWRSRVPAAVALAGHPLSADALSPSEAANFRNWIRLLSGDHTAVRELNETFVARRLAEEKVAFDCVESYPLTTRQRTAIVSSEDTTLVIAGAGTGKTSTIVGKVDYLVRRQLAKPEQILVLAFAKKASEEIKDRLQSFGSAATVDSSTFHALGLRIVSQVEGARPSLSKLAEDERLLKRFIRDRVAEMLLEAEGRKLLILFLVRHANEDQPLEQHANGDAHIRAEKIQGLRALDGTKLKSNEEKQIANWFILNGIKWEYERPYPFPTATPWHRSYQPDFYLPEYDLYLEHFGIDRNNRTAPHVDRPKYLAAMEWKRQLHKERGTKLLETFSWMSHEGGLIPHLERLLASHDVRTRPLTADEVASITTDANQPFSDFVSLLAQFLAVFKGSGVDLSEITIRASSPRDKAFLAIFSRSYDAYEKELERTELIDFNDMINRARRYVQEGRFKSAYRAIIVDEFQDISENRIGLLQDIRQHQPGCRLFAVGDDWQSIYRFAGSDIGIITRLQERVGATERVDLDIAFRYPQELLDVTTHFVTRNPVQLRKALRSHHVTRGAIPLCVIYESPASGSGESASQPSWVNERSGIETALADITGKTDGTPGTVFILGRYHFNAPTNIDAIKRLARESNLTVEFMTAHAAKGKEADYVIVVGLDASEYGFPSRISDDPVMTMVLSTPELFPFAEERRLFYVAMTRSKYRTYLIVPNINSSPFIAEDLLGDELARYVEVIGEESDRYRCPSCGGKTIRRKEGQFGTFWACAHFPLCHGKLNACPSCKDGGLEQFNNDPGNPRYRCTLCGFATERCPRCGKGVLIERSGQRGPFLGCSCYDGGAGCTYTRSLPKNKA